MDAQAFVILSDLIIPLAKDRETVIGRDNTKCDVVIADPRVSKKHASIYFENDNCFIKDLNSLNGTLVNREKICNFIALASGDEITLPLYKMAFANHGHPRIRQMKQSRLASLPNQPSVQFAGHLNILSISDLLQLLNTTKQSGILTLRNNNNESASVSIHSGEILDAKFRKQFGEHAVYEVRNLTGGHFEFLQGVPPVPENPVKKPTLNLLLNGCRILDEIGEPAKDGVSSRTGSKGNALISESTAPLF